LLEELRKGMEPSAVVKAESAAAMWAPHPTALTMRARLGIEEARRIAQ
jgi:hypothetical protein